MTEGMIQAFTLAFLQFIIIVDISILKVIAVIKLIEQSTPSSDLLFYLRNIL